MSSSTQGILAAITAVIVVLILSYLTITGLVAVVLYAFSIEYNVWLAGLGTLAVAILIKTIMRG